MVKLGPDLSRPRQHAGKTAPDGSLTQSAEPRFTSFFKVPTWGRPVSVAIIAGLLVFLAFVDWITGPYVALRLLYDIPVVLAIIWMGRAAGIVTAGVIVTIWLGMATASHALYVQWPQILWNVPVYFAGYLVLVFPLASLIRLHRELELRVRQRTAALEREISTRLQLQREVLFTSDRERSAIGQDLHDGLCQHLVGTALSAQVLAERLASCNAPCTEEARNLVRLVEEGIAQTRHLARGLLLASITPERLPSELEELAATMSRQSGVPCRFVMQGECDAQDEQTASHLFLIAQEAVRNALRHARPQSLEIVLAASEGQLTLIVSDDGAGLPSKRTGRGMGLRIMEHRAKIIGGDLTVERIQGGGTSIHFCIPAGNGVG